MGDAKFDRWYYPEGAIHAQERPVICEIIFSRRMKRTFFFLLWLAALAPLLEAQPTRISLEPLVSGLAQPVLLTHAKDGSNRRFIVEQPGRIRVLQPGAVSSTVFLDITSRVRFGGERGLLGLAFHPQFSTNRRFYVNYTRQPDGATVVAEYHASAVNPNTAETAETALLTIPQPFENHSQPGQPSGHRYSQRRSSAAPRGPWSCRRVDSPLEFRHSGKRDRSVPSSLRQLALRQGKDRPDRDRVSQSAGAIPES
jgi:hypothetical protein